MVRVALTITLTRALWHQGYLTGVHQDFVNYEAVPLDGNASCVIGDDDRLASNDVFPAPDVVSTVVSKTHPCLRGNCLGYCPEYMVKHGDLYRPQAASSHHSCAIWYGFSVQAPGCGVVGGECPAFEPVI